ncbi:Uma2 family endonuclease [Lentzea pudingi]|uniref:Uma2 family endonuclease n=1 Tax=Lentzea pudingi TaxID=1789439 RepID=UPI001E5F0AD0|nr:Uma2 family endonuclease [Lentzea pudingi]
MAAPAEARPDVLLPAHEGPWTIEDVLALPEDNSQRIELLDGMLHVSPMGNALHQRLVFEASYSLRGACPKELETTIELNVQFDGDRLFIPDFTVLKKRGAKGLTVPAADVLLIGEVLSRSTKVNDLVLKRQVYAEAGISYYLIIDPAQQVPKATLFELEEGEYVELARSEAGVLTFERPFPVTLELAS